MPNTPTTNSDIYNDGALPHGSFAATLSNGITYDFERFVPDHPTKTINQYNPAGAPQRSVDVRDFNTAQATIQVPTEANGVPQNMPPLGTTLTFNDGMFNATWRLKSVNGPGFNTGEYWKFETTWQMNEN
jgi:hypothetical protein